MKLFLLSLLCVPLLASVPVRAQDASAFLKETAARAATGEGFALKGDAPGWLFLRDDVTHASKGAFWKGGPGPALAIITKFRESLTAAGVTLILAPVPSKAGIYPDKLISGAAPDAGPSSAAFLEELKTTGATVVDLETLFRQEREKTPVFCATDSHWSPAGAVLAATGIAEIAAAVPGLTPLLKPGTYVTAPPEKFVITGDLAAAPAAAGTAPEELLLTKTGTGSASAPTPVPAAPTSPVILMGDSHTMVFTDGASLGMHCQGAGLRDHLQARLGFPLIQLSNQNSGATGARRLLNQRLQTNPAYLKNVKAVIWVFSIREFTLGKWR
jgi:alginate O-acetyltransferase complex protein AlgJ